MMPLIAASAVKSGTGSFGAGSPIRMPEVIYNTGTRSVQSGMSTCMS